MQQRYSHGRSPINWVKQIFFNIATYSSPQDGCTNILPNNHILFTYALLTYCLCYFNIELIFYILYPNIF